MKNIAILVSGSGTNAEAIIKYFAESHTAKVAIVISDNPSAYALTRAHNLGVRAESFTRHDFKTGIRPLEMLREVQTDFVVLAGFLSMVPRRILEAYPDRIINIHPALLPKFGGKGMYGENVHKAVIAAHETESGITIHKVNEHYDSGSIVAQFKTSVTPDDTPDTLAAKIHVLEHANYARVTEGEILKLEQQDRAKRIMMISNSTTAGEPYLKYPIQRIGNFLKGVKEVAFIPYAAVTFSYDEYETKVQARFDEIGVRVHSVHHDASPADTVSRAEAIVIGGGNTFALIDAMQRLGLCEAVRNKVNVGIPYVGWSAGSNVCCPTISTTNDMPIVEPDSFAALNLIKFQINPHYTDAHLEGHAGETREQRIAEYIEANAGVQVAGLREGCILTLTDGTLSLWGKRPMRIFMRGTEPREVNPGDELSFLL